MQSPGFLSAWNLRGTYPKHCPLQKHMHLLKHAQPALGSFPISSVACSVLSGTLVACFSLISTILVLCTEPLL